ncbi:MAG: hypothetical protein A2Y25_02265 [Candidatus Melainabacteria bacterium GWF2_37_15]|nr:MAG: hypothetical protein A2Y25_02265 [Candidatus Melainabacteria bacterium GWF2_37_15]
MDAKEIAQELRDILRKYEDFVGLYLYGSYAKGTAGPDSDIDIAAIFEKDRSSETDVHGETLEIELEHDVIIDFQPTTLEELNLNWIYFNEVKKGFYYGR